MTRSLLRRGLLFPAVAFLALSCDSAGGAPKVPLAQAAIDSSPKAVEAAHALIGPEAKAALDSGNAMMRKASKADSGNAAMRKEDYVRALADYRRAAELAPQNTAPIFGIYMVAGATKNKHLADSAMVAIRARMPAGDSSALVAPHSMSDSALNALRAQMKKGTKPI
jgi:hypothetical protein